MTRPNGSRILDSRFVSLSFLKSQVMARRDVTVTYESKAFSVKLPEMKVSSLVASECTGICRTELHTILSRPHADGSASLG